MSIPLTKIKDLTFRKRYDNIYSDRKKQERCVYMDYSLDIIISEKDLSYAGLREIKFCWGGKEYCHTPRKFETEDSLILNEIDSRYINNILLKNTSIDMPVMFSPCEVYDLRHTSYCCPDELYSHNLMKFLKRVSGLEKFNIYLCGCDELIDYNIKYTGESDISEIIYRAFVDRKSVMIYK